MGDRSNVATIPTLFTQTFVCYFGDDENDEASPGAGSEES